MSNLLPDCNAKSFVSLYANTVQTALEAANKCSFASKISNCLTELGRVLKNKSDLEELSAALDLNSVNNGIFNPSAGENQIFKYCLDVITSKGLSAFITSMKTFEDLKLLPAPLVFQNKEAKARFASLDCDYEITMSSKHKRDVINAYLVLLGIGEKNFLTSPFVTIIKNSKSKFSYIRDQLERSLIYSPIKEVFYMFFLDRSKIGLNPNNCSEEKKLQIGFDFSKTFGYDGSNAMHLYYGNSKKYMHIPQDKLGVHCALFEEMCSILRKGIRFNENTLKQHGQNILNYDILGDYEQPLATKNDKHFVYRPHVLIDDASDIIREKD